MHYPCWLVFFPKFTTLVALTVWCLWCLTEFCIPSHTLSLFIFGFSVIEITYSSVQCAFYMQWTFYVRRQRITTHCLEVGGAQWQLVGLAFTVFVILPMNLLSNDINNRLFMATHLVRAQSTHKDIRIHSFHTHTHTHTLPDTHAHTHTHTHTHTHYKHTWTFVTPRVNTKTFAERSFSYAGPSVWNNLPQTLRHSDSTSSFKAALKTHLFNNYF